LFFFLCKSQAQLRDYKASDEIGSLIKTFAVTGLQVLEGDALIGCDKKNNYLQGIRGVVVV
jgi:hypothetical protein